MSLLTATLESTADGILVISSEGKIAGLNEQFLTMWGIPPELMKGVYVNLVQVRCDGLNQVHRGVV